MKNNSKNVYDMIIYTLFIIFICILFYSFIKLVYYKLSMEPKNSTNVSSPLSLTSNNSANFFYEVTYCDINTPSSLNNLNSANLIYEYLPANSTPIYKGIFDTVPEQLNSTSYSLSMIPTKYLPSTSKKVFFEKNNGSTNNANFIFSKIFYNHTSNFVYKDSYYIHYLRESPQLDSLTNKPISVSNVVIQIVNEPNPCNYSIGSGSGYICYNGTYTEITWKKDSNSIKFTDKDGLELFIPSGKTWWIIATPNDDFLFQQ